MRDSLGRYRRTTAAERARLLEEFRRAGLTAEEFCRREGMAQSTLQTWMREARREARRKGGERSLIRAEPSLPAAKRQPVVAARAAEPSFRQVELPSWLVPAGDWAVELVSPGGLTIRLRDGLETPDLLVLLRD